MKTLLSPPNKLIQTQPPLFRIGGGTCQPYPVTSRNWELMKEPGSQVHSDILNRHTVNLLGLRPDINVRKKGHLWRYWWEYYFNVFSTILVFWGRGGKKFYPYQPFIQINSPSVSLPVFHSRLHTSPPLPLARTCGQKNVCSAPSLWDISDRDCLCLFIV